MINEINFKEMQDNIEMELYEALEVSEENLTVTICNEKKLGIIIVHLETEDENRAAQEFTKEDFNKLTLDELNRIVNGIYYYYL